MLECFLFVSTEHLCPLVQLANTQGNELTLEERVPFFFFLNSWNNIIIAIILILSIIAEV